MIIFRHLTRELAVALSIITGVLLLIFFSTQFVIIFNKAALGKMATNLLLTFVGIEIPHILSILLPCGLFLAVLFGYGRLYADYEMTALNACGLGPSKIITYTLPITLFVVVIVAILTLWLNPKLIAYRNNLLNEKGSAIALQTSIPGRFQESDNGRTIIYIESMSTDRKHMQNLFMAQLPKTTDNSAITPWTIFATNSGYQTINPQTKEPFFVAASGQRYEGIPGQKDFQIAHFDTYSLRIEKHIDTTNTREETLPTFVLLRGATEKTPTFSAEFQWRLASPISALLLAMLAIPLSRFNPRQGKYLQLIPAFLIYIIYLNLLIIGRNTISDGNRLLYHFGLWPIHLGMLIIIAGIWINTIGWRSFKRSLSKPKVIST